MENLGEYHELHAQNVIFLLIEIFESFGRV